MPRRSLAETTARIADRLDRAHADAYEAGWLRGYATRDLLTPAEFHAIPDRMFRRGYKDGLRASLPADRPLWL
jgi:ribosome modulation factor|tara:strand:- start:182 stop:400 length:219 start_codon:yes stop_codon:yes gene_type:complete